MNMEYTQVCKILLIILSTVVVLKEMVYFFVGR